MEPDYRYLVTLDSHDYFGPFFDTAGHSAFYWAKSFAEMRGYRSFQIISRLPYFIDVSGPVTCPIYGRQS